MASPASPYQSLEVVEVAAPVELDEGSAPGKRWTAVKVFAGLLSVGVVGTVALTSFNPNPPLNAGSFAQQEVFSCVWWARWWGSLAD